MIPMPIFIPSGSTSGADFIFPKWVEVVACFGGIALAVGLLWMLAAIILSIITDDKIDAFEKPHSYSMALSLLGAAVLLVAVVLMLLTGQKVTE